MPGLGLCSHDHEQKLQLSIKELLFHSDPTCGDEQRILGMKDMAAFFCIAMVRLLKSAHVDVGIHFFLSKFFVRKVYELALLLLDHMDNHDTCTPWSSLHCMAFHSRCPMFQISRLHYVSWDSWLPHCKLYGFSLVSIRWRRDTMMCGCWLLPMTQASTGDKAIGPLSTRMISRENYLLCFLVGITFSSWPWDPLLWPNCSVQNPSRWHIAKCFIYAMVLVHCQTTRSFWCKEPMAHTASFAQFVVVFEYDGGTHSAALRPESHATMRCHRHQNPKP